MSALLACPAKTLVRLKSFLQIDDKKIRLFGFDAPEKAQSCKNAQGADYSCGKHILQQIVAISLHPKPQFQTQLPAIAMCFAGLQSGEALHSMIGSNPVRCEVRNKDQYGRNVSSCSVLTSKGPVDIGNFMVSNGYAVAYRYKCLYDYNPSIVV